MLSRKKTGTWKTVICHHSPLFALFVLFAIQHSAMFAIRVCRQPTNKQIHGRYCFWAASITSQHITKRIIPGWLYSFGGNHNLEKRTKKETSQGRVLWSIINFSRQDTLGREIQERTSWCTIQQVSVIFEPHLREWFHISNPIRFAYSCPNFYSSQFQDRFQWACLQSCVIFEHEQRADI